MIIVDTFAKICTNHGIHFIDFSFVRIFSNFIIAVLNVIRSRKHIIHDVPVHCRKVIIMRSITGVVGSTSAFYAFKVLPIFIVKIIFNTLPFWVSILEYFVLNERVSKFNLYCMVACFTGVVIIAHSKSSK